MKKNLMKKNEFEMTGLKSSLLLVTGGLDLGVGTLWSRKALEYKKGTEVNGSLHLTLESKISVSFLSSLLRNFWKVYHTVGQRLLKGALCHL